MNQQDRRPSVGGGDKTAPVTDDRATPADVTQRDHEALVAYAFASDLQNDPLVIDLCTALAAERDRADRAEARLADVNATVDKFAGRKYDAEVQPHGDPEYWRGAEHAQDYIVHRLRAALGNAEATA